MFTGVMKNTDAVSNRHANTYWKMVLAVGGITTGILLILAALMLWASSALEKQNHDNQELILILAAFVFLGLGAHGFDLLHSAKRAAQKRRLNL